jgi:endo-1,4-beta-mannosidase
MKVLKLLVINILIFSHFLSPAIADDIQYLWAGANQYRIWMQSQNDIAKQLDAMQEAGLKVLRIFLGEAPYQSWETPPDAYTFEPTFGSYDDANLAKVDYLMQQCQNRGIKLIIVLNNHSDEYLDTYGAIGMYSMPAAITNYKNRFSYFLNHENSYLNKKWKDCDDVVYAWEIQNEPGLPLINVASYTSKQKHDMMCSFLNQLATHLKTIDPNTKVSLGIAGYANYYHNGGTGDDIRTLGNITDRIFTLCIFMVVTSYSGLMII